VNRFPLGAHLQNPKFTKQKLLCGRSDRDRHGINIGASRRRFHLGGRDIRGVVETSHTAGAIVKVIIETSLLNDEEKIKSLLLAKEADATSSKPPQALPAVEATVEDVALMRRVVGPEMGVKASGWRAHI